MRTTSARTSRSACRFSPAAKHVHYAVVAAEDCGRLHLPFGADCDVRCGSHLEVCPQQQAAAEDVLSPVFVGKTLRVTRTGTIAPLPFGALYWEGPLHDYRLS